MWYKEHYYLVVEICHLANREGCWVVFYLFMLSHENHLNPLIILMKRSFCKPREKLTGWGIGT